MKEKLIVSLVMLVIALVCYGLVYSWSKNDCEKRGGHIEVVYGSKSGWTCDGAER